MESKASEDISPHDRSDRSRTATETHPRDDSRSAEKRLEAAIDQAALAIGQLKARGNSIGERRARSAYKDLRAALEDAEERREADE